MFSLHLTLPHTTALICDLIKFLLIIVMVLELVSIKYHIQKSFLFLKHIL